MADGLRDLLLPSTRPGRTRTPGVLDAVDLPTGEQHLARLVWAHRADDAKLLDVLCRVPPVDRRTARIVLTRELGPARAATLATRAYGAAHGLAPSVPSQGAPAASPIPSIVRYNYARSRALADTFAAVDGLDAPHEDAGRELLAAAEPHISLAASSLLQATPGIRSERLQRAQDGKAKGGDRGRALLGAAERRAATLYRRERSSGHAPDPDDPAVEEALGRRAGGEPLPERVRVELEQRLGADFQHVRIHLDDVADRAAQALEARAFTVGDDIFFGAGAYAPETPEGRALLAHELAHVVQGQKGRVASGASATMRVSQPQDALEREADAVAARVGVDDEKKRRGSDRAAEADDEVAHGEATTGAPRVSRGWLDTLAKSAGAPLPVDLRGRLEHALDVDLGGVRVHTGPVSDAAARNIHARAFTVGKDIHVAAGQYDSGSRRGQELIAHEVAHALQGGGATDFTNATISAPGDAPEIEAERFASEFVRQMNDADRTKPTHGGPRAPHASMNAAALGDPASRRALGVPAAPIRGIRAGSVSTATIHRDAADGPLKPPTAKAKPKTPPPEANAPEINEGELQKKKKEANDPEQDRKDKANFEKDNPKAPKDPEPIKPEQPTPTVAAPKPNAKKGGNQTPAKKGGPPEKADVKTPPKAAPTQAAKPAPPAPKQGPAEAAVCAAVDEDVAKFWASAQKDPAANEISKRSSEIWAAAQGLGPAESDDMIGALNPATAVYNDGFGQSDLGQAIAGLDQSKSPYAEFNEKYRGLAKTFAAVRDVSYNVSNVLGKIGLVLTVVGFILSLFGVGAILVTIGRVISVINLILDVVAAAAGAVLAGITAAQIKEETDPYKRAKLAKLLISDVNKAASNVVNVVLAGEKVGKVVAKPVIGIGKALRGVARPIAKAISRVYQAVSKFFAGLAKAKGVKGAIGRAFVGGEKIAVGLGKKAMSNRAKVLAQFDPPIARNNKETAARRAEKAGERAGAKHREQSAAEANLSAANQKKLDAENALAQKRGDAAARQKEMEATKTEATTKKGELESARQADKSAKQQSAAAEKQARATERAQKKAEEVQRAKDEAAKTSASQSKAAEEAARKATEQRISAEVAEKTARESVDRAVAAEKRAAAAAKNAQEAADRARSTAGADAEAAAKASQDAQRAAADAQHAAENVAAAQKEAQQARQAAERAAQSEKALNEAKANAAAQAEAAAKAQEAASRRAAEAQKAAAEAEAAATKAKAEQAAAEKVQKEAQAAASERARADAAKKAADEALARKVQAEAAAAKAKQEAQRVAEQRAAAEKAARERADAEAKAVEQQKAAQAQKAEALKQQQAAERAAAESKAKADRAAKEQAAADAQVKKDQADVARREAELKQAEAERQAKASKEAADKAAAESAQKKAEAAAEAKRTADQNLERDTKKAQEARADADAKKSDWEQKQKDAKLVADAKKSADEAAKKAQEASKAADRAAKEADGAAKRATKEQQDAERKKKEADNAARDADDAKSNADKEAREAEARAQEAEHHKLEIEQHAKDSSVLDPDKTGSVPQPSPGVVKDIRPDNPMAAQGLAVSGTTYSLGQMQQELATKNDPRDPWGLHPRRDLDASKMRPRAARMGELKASSPRHVNVSDAVAKIFAKKKEDSAQPAGSTPTAPTSGGSATVPAPAPQSQPAVKSDGNATAAEVGPIPYWPDLLKNYSFDLNAMSEARSQVQAYKSAQQAAVQTAKNDLKKRAAEIRAEAAARKEPVKQNQDGLNKDKANLDESKAGNKKQIEHDDKNEQEKAKADGPGKEGADAAERAAAAEPPPAKGWWGKIKAAANWFLKNTLGRAMRFVTDAITNVVLKGIKVFMGLDVKEMANFGMTTADAGNAKAAEGTSDTTKAGADNNKVETDIAAEDMTLGQRIAAGEKNVREAEEFEKAIDAQEEALKQEIKACQDFVKQVEEQFAKCKAEAETKGKDEEMPAEGEQHGAAPPSPANDGGASAPSGDEKATLGVEQEALLKEAQNLCTGSVDTEIANLQALDAKGAQILMAGAANDPGAIAEAERLTHGIQNGALKSAIQRLEALKGKAAGSEDAAVSLAQDIDAACSEGADAVIAAYTVAEQEMLSAPFASVAVPEAPAQAGATAP